MYQMLERADFDIDKEKGIGLFQSASVENVLMEPPEKMHTDLHFSGNNTGLPDSLRTGIEALSGYSMSDVKVHYHSDKPAKMGAAAYTQGTEIYVASGQERFLPHESWHVIQQFQGRVKPTSYQNGIGVNESESLEQEADQMGKKALSFRPRMLQNLTGTPLQKPTVASMPLCQKKITQEELAAAIEQIKQAFAENNCTLVNEAEVFTNILPLNWTKTEFNQIVLQISYISHNNETDMNVQTNSGEVFAVRHINGNVPVKLFWTQTGNNVEILGVYRHNNDSRRYELLAGPGPKHFAITPKKVIKPIIPKKTQIMHPPKKRK